MKSFGGGTRTRISTAKYVRGQAPVYVVTVALYPIELHRRLQCSRGPDLSTPPISYSSAMGRRSRGSPRILHGVEVTDLAAEGLRRCLRILEMLGFGGGRDRSLGAVGTGGGPSVRRATASGVRSVAGLVYRYVGPCLNGPEGFVGKTLKSSARTRRTIHSLRGSRVLEISAS